MIARWPTDGRLFRGAAYAFHLNDFLWRHRRWPRAPDRDFNDFLFARKVDGSLADPFRRRVSDKEHAKAFIADRLGKHRTTETVAVLRSPEDIGGWRPDAFPVVVKPTHSSGRVLIIDGEHALGEAVPVMRRWLDHCFFSDTLELNYRELEPKVIAERFIPDTFLYEGSIHCRAGKPRVISIIDRFSADKRRASLDSRWQPLDVALGHPYRPLAPPALPYRDRLLHEASMLAEPFDFIRVDFYASGTGFIFGELTNLPAGGLGRFDPPDGGSRFSAAFFAD